MAVQNLHILRQSAVKIVCCHAQRLLACFCRLPTSSRPPVLGEYFDPSMNPAPDMNIEYVANLARLALTEVEKTKFTQQLGDILHYVEKLKQVDVAGIEPMAHASPVFNIWAADVPVAGLPVEKALQNAPWQRDNLIAIPKVME